MQEEVRVVLDAMGGDHAPEEMIKGAVEAVNEKNNIHLGIKPFQTLWTSKTG